MTTQNDIYPEIESRDGPSETKSTGIVDRIVDAFNYPRESEDVVKTVLIGGLLTLFSFLLIPAFFAGGYLLRVLERTAAGDDEPPVFEGWGDLGIEGLKAFLITMVYGSVPFVIGGALLAVSLAIGSGGDALGAIGALGMFLAMTVWFALGLAVAYVVPAALANYAEKRTIGAGFDVATLKPVLTNKTYAIGWLTAFAVILIGGVLASVVGVVPLLGQIAGAFIGFYVAMGAYAVIGRTWADLRSPGSPSVRSR